MLSYSRGDADAFETLYRRHRGGLYRYLCRQCGNNAIAEELFQDVWTSIIRTRKSYTVRARFTTYLYHLARNRLTDHYRRQARGPALQRNDNDDAPIDALAADPSADPVHAVAVERQAARLMEVVSALPQVQREAFLLREEAGLTLDEIAQVTGVGRETAKSRLRYAVARLRSALGEETDGH